MEPQKNILGLELPIINVNLSHEFNYAKIRNLGLILISTWVVGSMLIRLFQLLISK